MLGGTASRGESAGAVRKAGDLDARLRRLLAEARVVGADIRAELDTDAESSAWRDAAADTVYHVVHEGLTNARRYGPGAPITVTVGRYGEWLRVRVRNREPRAAGTSGAPATLGTGHGIEGLRERVEACGGKLFAGAVQGGGFVVEARLPVVPSENGGASS